MNVDAVKYYLKNPVAFVREVLNATPEPQQIEVLEAMTLYKSISVRAGHGVGKTSVAAWTILWFITLHPMARILCTAPTQHQLEDILWPEVKKWLEGSPLKSIMTWTKTHLGMKGYEDLWFAVPRTSNKPDNLQGAHEKHFMIVVDEAPGVAEDVMEAVDGAMTNEGAMILMIGNPTKLSGTFYDSFHKDRGLYNTFAFSCQQSALVSQSYIDRMADKYGEDSDVFRVRVLGEFPKGTPDAFIRLDAVEAAMLREVVAEGPISIGVDPARYGDDNSVIYWRRGYKVFEPISFNGINTSRLSGEVSNLVKEIRGIYPDAGTIAVNIDDTGVGGGVTDQLEDQEYTLDIEVCPQNFGGKGDEDHADQAASMWGNLKTLMPLLGMPERAELISQLTTRKYGLQPDGKIKLERKEAMKKRGLPSPDEGDALALCLWESAAGTIRIL